tara:strand:+ start:4432 stop:4884 length:453 start_codon:yes stop_codon:yes gene_type:complete
MDIKKIFELFEIEGKGVPISDDELDVIEKFDIFKDTPIYKIGMFVKIILNYNVIKNQILKIFKESNQDIDLEDVEEAGKLLHYGRAFVWIEDCDLAVECWREGWLFRNNEETIKGIEDLVFHFELIEEYEKCNILHKITTFLKSNLASED